MRRVSTTDNSRHFRNEKGTGPSKFSQRLLALLGEGKIWPIADRRVPNNDPRNKSRAHFGSSILLLTFRERMYWFVFVYDLYFAWHKRNLCGAENFFTHKEVRKQTINASKSYILCHSTSILKESRQRLFKYQKYHLEKPHNAIHNFH